MSLTPVASRNASHVARGRCSPAAGDHGLVCRGRGEADRHAVLLDEGGELVGGGALDEQGGGADPHREDDQPAEAEGEGDGRGSGEDVAGLGAEHVVGEGVGVGEHVAVEVHGRLGAAGGAGRERQHGDVVGGGVDVGEVARLLCSEGVELAAVAGGAVGHGAQLGDVGCFEVVGEAAVAEGELELPDRADGGELTGPQHRHGGDDHAAGLEHCEPAGDQARVVRAAQQHAVARHQAEVLDEHVGDAVGPLEQVAVGPARPVRDEEAGTVRAETLDHGVEQLDGAVEALGVLHLRHVEAQHRPLLLGRQVVAAERVDVGGRAESHPGPLTVERATSLSALPPVHKYVLGVTTVKSAA
jgi:hypothetical protein